MKKLTRGIVLFMALMLIQLSIIPPNQAFADSSQISLTELSIKIMPEFINPDEWDYNTPSLLVGYHGTIKNVSEEPFSGDIQISVPTDLPEFTIGYVAQYIEETDEHVNIESTVNSGEGFVTLTAPEVIESGETFQFILEYFAAPIEGVVDRSFTFDYKVESDLENLNFAFYAPYRAENFTLSKEETQKANSFGVEIYVYEYEDVKQGEVHDFEVSYSKEDIVTTVDAFNDFTIPEDDAHAGLGFEGAGSASTDDSLLSTENILLLSITVLVVGAFLFVVLRKKKEGTKTAKPAAPKKIINKEEEIKKLRKMLADGQIDEKTYKEKRAKLG